MTVAIGLVGYGVGGRFFHAPYIDASDGCALSGIVARSPDRVAEAQADWPGVPVFASLAELLDSGVRAVVVSTPPATRRQLVLEAIASGAHVVADKPFASSAAEGQELTDAAAAAGVLLNVFHNRRLDSDIVTARSVIESGALGAIQRLDLRCDQDDPGTLEGGPEGGLLRDLGSHVVDQALHLLGPADNVSAHIDWRDLPAGHTDVAFTISIQHTGGAHSHISSSKLHGLESREIRLLGERGSYMSDYRDVQVDAIRAGRRPVGAHSTWGIETEERWGTLHQDGVRRIVPSEQGDYTRFYDAFARAITEGDSGPVPASEGVSVLRVLDAARLSAAKRQVVQV